MSLPEPDLNKSTSISTTSTEDVSQSGSSMSYMCGHVDLENSTILFPMDENDCRKWENLFEARCSFEHQHDSTNRSRSNDSFITYSEIPTPVLPRIVEHSKPLLCREEGQMEILPCPSTQVARPRIDDGEKFVDRFELLNTLRTQSEPREQHRTSMQNNNNNKARWQHRVEQITAQKKQKKTELADRDPDVFPRRSLFYFVLGFLFPPFWIIGALNTPSLHAPSKIQRIDLMWKRRSRNACIVLSLVLLSMLVIAIALNPSLVGMRKSNDENRGH